MPARRRRSQSAAVALLRPCVARQGLLGLQQHRRVDHAAVEHADAAGLWYAIREAMLVHGRSRDEWRKLAINGMRQDFSWGASSSRYAALYQAMLAERHPRA